MERSASDELCFLNSDLKFIYKGVRDWYKIVKIITFSRKQCLLWELSSEIK